MSSSSSGSSDWTEYYSKSNQTWCWMSKARKVTYLAASRSQMTVFKAGWVVLPAKKGDKINKFYNVFKDVTVMDRSEIDEYVDPSQEDDSSSSRKRPLPDDENDHGGAAKKPNHSTTQQQQQQRQGLPNGKGNVSKVKTLHRGITGDQRKIAIIVPFRDEHTIQKRSQHLKQFIPYMITYMKRAQCPFHIFIIEQSSDKRKFNRGKLLNAGYHIAKQRKCSAFIFHDVDLLPNDELLNHYRCDGKDFEKVPDHIARIWTRYSGNKDYIGGVTAFSGSCFERLNGFPNNFWGWGGEDDEVRNRLGAVKQHFSSPKSGSLKDLENMTIQEKVTLLRKQNTDRQGSDNTWKCMVKNEVLKSHAKTWRENGLYHTGKDSKRVETKLYSRFKEDVHPSGLASKITVELTKNNDRWDTVTSWKDL